MSATRAYSTRSWAARQRKRLPNTERAVPKPLIRTNYELSHDKPLSGELAKWGTIGVRKRSLALSSF